MGGGALAAAPYRADGACRYVLAASAPSGSMPDRGTDQTIQKAVNCPQRWRESAGEDGNSSFRFVGHSRKLSSPEIPGRSLRLRRGQGTQGSNRMSPMARGSSEDTKRVSVSVTRSGR